MFLGFHISIYEPAHSCLWSNIFKNALCSWKAHLLTKKRKEWIHAFLLGCYLVTYIATENDCHIPRVSLTQKKLKVWYKFCRPAQVKQNVGGPALTPGLKGWQSVILQPFSLQRLSVSLWKDLYLIFNIIFSQETGNILQIGSALSKRPIYIGLI